MSSIREKFKGKRVALLGFGIENQAFLGWLQKQKIECEIVICDQKKELDLVYPDLNQDNISWNLGINFDKNLEKFDIILRVPGYPLFKPEIKKAIRAGAEVTSPTKLFFEFSSTKNIIGVTGTKGKGTTSGLIVEIISMAGKKVYWGGNIGIPIFNFFSKLKKTDYVVLELSSFQLEDLEVSPHVAVITNLSREHLKPADPINPNYHKSMEDYIRAKLNVVKFQKKGDMAILNKKIQFSGASTRRGQYQLGRGKKIYFSKLDHDSRLIGDHNKENIAAAAKAAKAIGIREAVIKKGVKKFKGLPHRIEFVGKFNRNKYYDDSFATIPESSIIALKSFDAPIILLAGGADKGSSFKKFAKEIKKRTRFTVLLNGKATPKLKKELRRIGYMDMQNADSMKEAVRIACQQAKTEDVVLLSTGCASFGMFNNYKERGDLFKKEVKKT
ncbi:UDP-N-acetylmuramoyl-L-alanine--D-glutamate ligase [Candidatus Parcubacteria bacterium]|nr:UDP-N-acetylmuramoyl-L-alanine--D-glutamate ligase [Candidatus Parcubacteria bacterium]